MSLHNVSFQELMERCAELHAHLCPRQVLGIRMGLLGAKLLDIALPQKRKRVLSIVETDGCFSDGIAVAANCWVGRRTMRVEDYGKVAVTFVDTKTEDAWRIHPHSATRSRATHYAPDAKNRWEAMLLSYQRMPESELLVAQPVTLTQSVAAIISKAGHRVACDKCAEEIINERESIQDGRTLCRACLGGAYYRPLATMCSDLLMGSDLLTASDTSSLPEPALAYE